MQKVWDNYEGKEQEGGSLVTNQLGVKLGRNSALSPSITYVA